MRPVNTAQNRFGSSGHVGHHFAKGGFPMATFALFITRGGSIIYKVLIVLAAFYSRSSEGGYLLLAGGRPICLSLVLRRIEPH